MDEEEDLWNILSQDKLNISKPCVPTCYSYPTLLYKSHVGTPRKLGDKFLGLFLEEATM